MALKKIEPPIQVQAADRHWHHLSVNSIVIRQAIVCRMLSQNEGKHSRKIADKSLCGNAMLSVV